MKVQCSVKKVWWLLLIAIWGAFSYIFIDKRIFSEITSENVFTYLMCKVIAGGIIVGIVYAIIQMIKGTEKGELYKRVLLFVVPLFVVYVGAALLSIYRYGNIYDVTTGDTGLVLNCALNLTSYFEFHYLTSWLYIVSLMLIPYAGFIMYFKLIGFALGGGYLICRALNICENRRQKGFIAVIVYAFFMALPILESATNCHRLYWYAPAYVLFFCTIYLDYLEQKEEPKFKFYGMLFLATVVAHWRTEGIVVLVFAVPLVLIVYGIKGREEIVKLVVFFVIANICIAMPQNANTFSGRDDYSDVRLHPFYSYKITLMLKEGLNREEHADELEAIDKVISIEAIDRLNADIGEKTYSDGYIRWSEGYIGVRELYQMNYYRMYARGEIDSSYGGFGSEEFNNYADACKKIMIEEPILFIKTSWKTLVYTDENACRLEGRLFPEKIVPFKIVQCLYDIVGILMLLMLFTFTFLLKRKWVPFMCGAAMLGQAAIVFLLSPAAYYKYYSPICYAAVVFLFLYIFGEWKQKKRESKVK